MLFFNTKKKKKRPKSKVRREFPKNNPEEYVDERQERDAWFYNDTQLQLIRLDNLNGDLDGNGVNDYYEEDHDGNGWNDHWEIPE